MKKKSKESLLLLPSLDCKILNFLEILKNQNLHQNIQLSSHAWVEYISGKLKKFLTPFG
jgi:hypothetical protein